MSVLLIKGVCGFLLREWLRLVMREKFDDEISDDGKNAEHEYCGVERRSCKARVGGWLRLSMCC